MNVFFLSHLVRFAPVTNIGFLHFQLPLVFFTHKLLFPTWTTSISQFFFLFLYPLFAFFSPSFIALYVIFLLLLFLYTSNDASVAAVVVGVVGVVSILFVVVATPLKENCMWCTCLIGTYTFLFLCFGSLFKKIIALKMMHASTWLVMLLLRLLQKIIKFTAQISLSCN